MGLGLDLDLDLELELGMLQTDLGEDNSVPISARAKHPYQPDTMLLDDTQHTTYIHNLDQELAEVDTPGLVFAPFAEKVLSVPHSVLYTKPSGTELVLYTEPTSLTVPQDKDHVRKAILESRARARERTAQASEPQLKVPTDSLATDATNETNDYDPMDIDE